MVAEGDEKRFGREDRAAASRDGEDATTATDSGAMAAITAAVYSTTSRDGGPEREFENDTGGTTKERA